MSISASDGPAARLSVDGNDDAELYVIGNDLRTAAYGVGRIDERLPQGIYKLRAVRGGATLERLIDLSGDQLGVPMHIANFDSVAPIAPVYGILSSDIERVAQDAISAGMHCGALEGSDGACGLLVLGHAATDDPAVDPLGNVRIFPWRKIVSRLALDCEAEGQRIGEENWRGWFRRCEPGCYVLDYHNGVRWIRQAVLAARGWETRVFIRRDGSSADGKGPAAAPDISIQMARPGHPIVYDDHEQTIEVARRALELSRPIMVSDRFIEPLLTGKWDNPVMGLTGLHLFLEALERHRAGPDASEKRRVDMSDDMVRRGPEIVRTVLCNLRDLLSVAGDSVPADLAGLETRAAPFLQASPGPRSAVNHPPMFWASWAALRDASAETARFDVQPRMWAETALAIAAGPYFSWQPTRVSLSSYVRNAVTMGATEAVGPDLAGISTLAGAALDALGSGAARPPSPQGWDRERFAEIGKALGIPESVVKTL